MDPVSCRSTAALLTADPGRPFSLFGVTTVVLDPPGWLKAALPVDGEGPVGVGTDAAGVEAPTPFTPLAEE